MPLTLTRSISPSGFIDSLSLEANGPVTEAEVAEAQATIEALNGLAIHFQSVTKPTFVPKAEREGAAPAAPPRPATAQGGGALVVNVFKKPSRDGSVNPRAPLVVQLRDGTQLQTFDKKVQGLMGKRIRYVSEDSRFGKELKSFTIVDSGAGTNQAPNPHSEGHANF